MTWHIVPDEPAVFTQARLPAPVLAGVRHRQAGDLTVVRHDYATWCQLRERGLIVPSPLCRYSWPGRFAPWPHQIATAEFLIEPANRWCLVGNGLGCVDAATEYLSPEGWRRMDEYDGGAVAQYDPLTGKAEFVTPIRYVKLPCDDMIRVRTKYGIDQLLSPEHRVLLAATSNPGKLEVVPAVELLRRHDTRERSKRRENIAYSQAAIPNTFSIERPGMQLSDALIRLQIAVIADGHFPRGSSTARCVVRLKKERKKERLRLLLREAGIEAVEKLIPNDSTRSDRGFSIFRFQAPRRQKVFAGDWWDASEAQRRVIAEEVMKWDGAPPAGIRGPTFSTTDKDSADYIQYVFCSLGMTARIVKDHRSDKYNNGVCYSVITRTVGKPLGLRGTHSDGAHVSAMGWEKSPDGFKYCFTVPSSFLVLRRNGCVFLTGNSGKTNTALWAADYLMHEGAVRRVLVVAPLSVCSHVWARTIFTDLPHRKAAVAHGTATRRRQIAVDRSVDFLVVNHDGLHIIKHEVADARSGFDLIIYDEATAVKNAQSMRWRTLHALRAGRRLWLMTGTPTPQSPCDAYGLICLLRERKPFSFAQWRGMVMEEASRFRFQPRKSAERTVATWLQPATRYRTSEVFDVQKIDLPIDLSAEQKRLCAELKDAAAVEFDGAQINVANAAALLSKILQVQTAGIYCTDPAGERVSRTVPAPEFFDAVTRFIDQADTPVLVFAPFRAAVHAIHDAIAKAGFPVGMVTGDLSQRERAPLFDRLMAGELKAIVAVPETMSHGLTLTAARYVLWCAPPFKAESYEQANGRVIRPGQKNGVVIAHIVPSALVRGLYKRLESKARLQDSVLELLEGSDSCEVFADD